MPGHVITVAEHSDLLLRGRKSCNLTLAAFQLTSQYSHLTRVERRLARLEHLFAQLLPDVNLDEALASRPVQALTDTPNPATARSSPTHAITPSAEDQREGSISEVVPEEADGFDWQEDVDDLADGMASLHVEPTGAGYLGNNPSQFLASKDCLAC